MTRVVITTDGAKLAGLQRRLKEAGAKGLTRELNRELRLAVVPIKEAEIEAALSLPSAKDDGRHGLRVALASNVKIGISRSKYLPGARVYIPKGVVPGWKIPGKDTASARGWRHQVFGRGKYVHQVSDPGWWARTARRHGHQAEAHAIEAMDRVAKAIMRP